MTLTSITGWRDHIKAGHQYLTTAGNAGSRKGVFNNDLIFQLTVMAIEGFIVGLCQYHRRMPDDHTLSGLVAGLSEVCPMDADLVERIRHLERTDDICALTAKRRIPPSDAQVAGALAVGRAVAGFATDRLSVAATG